jgi:hypothetical protein
MDRRDGHGNSKRVWKVLEAGFSCLFVVCSFGAFFSLRQRSRGVFSGLVLAARLWFLPLGLQSEVAAPMYIAKFALVCFADFVAEVICCGGYGDWGISRTRYLGGE